MNTLKQLEYCHMRGNDQETDLQYCSESQYDHNDASQLQKFASPYISFL